MASSIYLIFGEDDFLVAEKAGELVKKLVPPEEQTLGLEVVNGRVATVAEAQAAIVRCKEALLTLGFFGSGKVVWFKDVNFLSDNVVGKSETVKEALGGLANIIKEGLPEGQVLVVTALKADKRFAFYKACKAAGELHEFAVSDKVYIAEKQASDMLNKILASAGLRMSHDVRQAFFEKVGTETRWLINEVEKLSLYIGDRQDVKMSDVRAVTSMSRNALAWDLADAFGKKDLRSCLEIQRQLLFQKESPIRLIVGIESRIRDLSIYREALDRKWLVEKGGYGGRSGLSWGNVPPDVDKMLSGDFERDPRKTHPYRVGLLAEQARHFTGAELKKYREAVTEAHVKLVSSSAPQSMTLELLIISMLGKRQKT